MVIQYFYILNFSFFFNDANIFLLIKTLTVEDLERNNGSIERPYFMTKSLKQIMHKRNEPAKKEEDAEV